MSLTVIGLGSDHGDDRVGLAAAQALQQQSLPAHVAVHTCANPALDLLPLLAGAQHAILLDAMVDGGTPGRVLCCAPEALATRAGLPGSHGVSVPDVLALAGSLGLLPARLQVLGVSIAPAEASAFGELSPAVRQALPQLVQQVLAAASEPTP